LCPRGAVGRFGFLCNSHNNPALFRRPFVQYVKDLILAVKMKIYYCNSAYDMVSYSQAKAIGQGENKN